MTFFLDISTLKMMPLFCIEKLRIDYPMRRRHAQEEGKRQLSAAKT
jgi:hypothetical protein